MVLFLTIRRTPRSALFPYTTLCRSQIRLEFARLLRTRRGPVVSHRAPSCAPRDRDVSVLRQGVAANLAVAEARSASHGSTRGVFGDGLREHGDGNDAASGDVVLELV